MPVAILENAIAAGPPLPRKRFTRSEVESILEAGLFQGQRLELIDGDLIDKMGQKPSHATAIQPCLEVLARFFGLMRVRIQLPIEAGPTDRERSVPEPDVAVLREAKDDYRHRHPNGRETLLVVEVADSTLRHDSTTKRDLYARAGVPEYWVVDLNGRRLLVHKGLDFQNGLYANVQSYSAEESLDAEGGTNFAVAALLP